MFPLVPVAQAPSAIKPTLQSQPENAQLLGTVIVLIVVVPVM